ncbi:MAG: hypothetical protein IT580_13020 [Verrucomicrobiales bacterium]|nr:hypothetical protein [Verrucomicrobiales bacterium]
MNSLEHRRRLLVTTAELQRVMLVEDFERVHAASRQVAHQIREKTQLAGVLLPLFGTVASVWSRRRSGGNPSDPSPPSAPSLLDRLLPLVRLGLSCWLALRR